MRGVTVAGKAIRALRKTRGWTQEVLAVRSGCDVKTIRAAEKSKRIYVSTLERIADALGVDCHEVVAAVDLQQTQASVQIAWRWIAAFNSRDAEAVTSYFHEDGEVMVFADRSMPGAGEFRGRKRVHQWATICFEAFHAEPVTPEICRVDGIGDRVFVRVDRPKVTCRPNGLATRVSVMWEFEVVDGQIAYFAAYPESGAMEGIFYPDGDPAE